jgi:hypothetical protein
MRLPQSRFSFSKPIFCFSTHSLPGQFRRPFALPALSPKFLRVTYRLFRQYTHNTGYL